MATVIDPIEEELTRIWEQVLKVRSIGVNQDFFELGGHSLAALQLFARIRDFYGRDLPLATIFEAPTVRHLAALVRTPGFTAGWASLVPIQPHGSKPALFCIHTFAGNVLQYRDLPKHLGGDQPVYGLQAVGLDGQASPLGTIVEMATHYLAEIRRLQPTGPLHLAGSSFGGLVAFEMAQQLQHSGEPAALVALFDTFAPGHPRDRPYITPGLRRLFNSWQRLAQHVDSLLAYSTVREKAGYLRARLARVRNPGNWKAIAGDYAHHPAPPVLNPVEQACERAWRLYEPVPFSGRLTLFRARQRPPGCYPDPFLGWGGLAAEIDVEDVPGHHGAILLEPRVRHLAQRLRARLATLTAAAANERTRESTSSFAHYADSH